VSAPAYRPIACADHERLEFAALTRQWLDLTVDGTGVRLMPLDVYARDGAEWLDARDEAGETRTIRLDRVSF
jgi:Rho-binding antiterminator